MEPVLEAERRIMNAAAPTYRERLSVQGLSYRWQRTGFVQWMLEDLRAHNLDPVDLRYLDLGCGTGEIPELLHRAGCRRLYGIDVAGAMLARMPDFVPDAHRVLGTIQDAPFRPGSFDVLTAAFTLHHLEAPRALFETADRLLAPGGRLYLLEYNATSPGFRPFWRLLLRWSTAPLRLLLKLKNRPPREDSIGTNPAHRMYGAAELARMAEPLMESQSRSHGLFLPWLDPVLDPDSPWDQRLARGFDRIDAMIATFEEGIYQWVVGTRP